ncbi:MAG: hypothetical protein ABI577_07190 [bacterium]
MNRASSLIFATATTALTGAAVVMAAGGTIFGLDKITPSGGQSQAQTNSAPAALVLASFQQELVAETAIAAVATEVPFAAAGWTQGATGGESEAITPDAPAPQPTSFTERSTPPPASTPAPATPTSRPAATVVPPTANPPELSEPPSFVMPPNQPAAKASTPPAITPVAPAAASPTAAAPTAPPAPKVTSTPKPRSNDDDDREEEDDD